MYIFIFENIEYTVVHIKYSIWIEYSSYSLFEYEHSYIELFK